MDVEVRREWSEWYGEKLGLDLDRRKALTKMVLYSTQTLMPDCSFCNRRLPRSPGASDIPIYRRCSCAGATSEWERLESKRTREIRQRSMDEWEKSVLSKAADGGKYPSSSLGADWHGVKRGPAGVAAEREVRSWLESTLSGKEKSWIYIYGPRGTGKTTLAGLIVQGAIRSATDCRYVRWSGLLHDIKAGWADKSPSNPLSELKKTKLLVIDDFGKDAGSEWVATTAFELIDSREQAGLQTVFTSNFAIHGAATRLGQDKAAAIEDRLRGRCKVVELGGESHR